MHKLLTGIHVTWSPNAIHFPIPIHGRWTYGGCVFAVRLRVLWKLWVTALLITVHSIATALYVQFVCCTHGDTIYTGIIATTSKKSSVFQRSWRIPDRRSTVLSHHGATFEHDGRATTPPENGRCKPADSLHPLRWVLRGRNHHYRVHAQLLQSVHCSLLETE